jgi:hypothetical protein
LPAIFSAAADFTGSGSSVGLAGAGLGLTQASGVRTPLSIQWLTTSTTNGDYNLLKIDSSTGKIMGNYFTAPETQAGEQDRVRRAFAEDALVHAPRSAARRAVSGRLGGRSLPLLPMLPTHTCWYVDASAGRLSERSFFLSSSRLSRCRRRARCGQPRQRVGV